MCQVSLVVFDECHHAQGTSNHPYRLIMADHYMRTSITARPKIFGMTASPIWNTTNPAMSIHTLQFNLFAKVFAVDENRQELEEHVAKPVEVSLAISV